MEWFKNGVLVVAGKRLVVREHKVSAEMFEYSCIVKVRVQLNRNVSLALKSSYVLEMRVAYRYGMPVLGNSPSAWNDGRIGNESRRAVLGLDACLVGPASV